MAERIELISEVEEKLTAQRYPACCERLSENHLLAGVFPAERYRRWGSTMACAARLLSLLAYENVRLI